MITGRRPGQKKEKSCNFETASLIEVNSECHQRWSVGNARHIKTDKLIYFNFNQCHFIYKINNIAEFLDI